MKKFIKYLSISLVLIVAGILVFDYAFNPVYVGIVKGNSMAPFLPDGSKFYYQSNLVPEVNDAVAFKCLSEKCVPKGFPISKDAMEIKILEKKQGDLYWFNGTNDNYPCENDSSKNCSSFDSDDYGWISEPDIEILGVFTEKIN